eukprot:13927965-Alexandrium_andersonii.AAC.1
MASSSQLTPLSSPLGASSTVWRKSSSPAFASSAGPGTRAPPESPHGSAEPGGKGLAIAWVRICPQCTLGARALGG